jgi:hypothetical protein
MNRTLVTVLGTLVVLGYAVSASAAPAIKVDCNKGGSINATLAHLAQAGNTRDITIVVNGTCKENITITAFDHLLLKGGDQGSALQDANGNAVVLVLNSYDVALQGFTISGGSGVNCARGSYCTLNANTVQGASDSGVRVVGSRALLTSNNILHNGGGGIRAEFGASLATDSNSISNNNAGIEVTNGSTLNARSDKIWSNYVGLSAFNGAEVELQAVNISGNQQDGVWIEANSTVLFDSPANVVTGNGSTGVSINDNSFAGFNFGNANNTVSGNGQGDVVCFGLFSATRGAGTVGGTTNCPN